MKKLLVGLLVVSLLAGVIAAVPFWFGLQTEKIYNQRMQELVKRGVSVTQAPYQRGWLSSSVQATMVFPSVPVTFSMTHQISHGPFPVERLVRGDYTVAPALATMQSQVNASLTGIPLSLPGLTAETTIDTHGDGQSTWQFAAAKSTLPQGVLEWNGGTGNFNFDAHWKHIQVNMRFTELALKTPQESLAVTGLGLDADLQAGGGGRLFGTHAVHIEKFTVGDKTAQGMRMQIHTAEAGNQTNITTQYQVKGLTLGAENYGPGVLNVEIRKLNTATLVKLETTINELNQKKLPEAQAGLILIGKLLESVAELAKGAPELEVTQLSFKLKQGEITGKAKLILDGTNASLQENPMLLINALSGEAQISVPAAIIETLAQRQAAQEIEALKASGQLTPQEQAKLSPEKITQIAAQLAPERTKKLATELRLVPNGGNFEATAILKRGRLLVNNEPFTPAPRTP